MVIWVYRICWEGEYVEHYGCEWYKDFYWVKDEIERLSNAHTALTYWYEKKRIKECDFEKLNQVSKFSQSYANLTKEVGL